MGKKTAAKHPGFNEVVKKIAGTEHLSQQSAGAILATASRNAGSKARKANPRLKRVKG